MKVHKIYRNANWTKRHYECTNVVACEAPIDVDIRGQRPGDWVEADPSVLEGLTMLWREGPVYFYGYL